MKKVLVADDNAAGRELARTVLERCGDEITEAANGFKTWLLQQPA